MRNVRKVNEMLEIMFHLIDYIMIIRNQFYSKLIIFYPLVILLIKFVTGRY